MNKNDKNLEHYFKAAQKQRAPLTDADMVHLATQQTHHSSHSTVFHKLINNKVYMTTLSLGVIAAGSLLLHLISPFSHLEETSAPTPIAAEVKSSFSEIAPPNPHNSPVAPLSVEHNDAPPAPLIPQAPPTKPDTPPESIAPTRVVDLSPEQIARLGIQSNDEGLNLYAKGENNEIIKISLGVGGTTIYPEFPLDSLPKEIVPASSNMMPRLITDEEGSVRMSSMMADVSAQVNRKVRNAVGKMKQGTDSNLKVNVHTQIHYDEIKIADGTSDSTLRVLVDSLVNSLDGAATRSKNSKRIILNSSSKQTTIIHKERDASASQSNNIDTSAIRAYINSVKENLLTSQDLLGDAQFIKDITIPELNGATLDRFVVMKKSWNNFSQEQRDSLVKSIVDGLGATVEMKNNMSLPLAEVLQFAVSDSSQSFSMLFEGGDMDGLFASANNDEATDSPNLMNVIAVAMQKAETDRNSFIPVQIDWKGKKYVFWYDTNEEVVERLPEHVRRNVSKEVSLHERVDNVCKADLSKEEAKIITGEGILDTWRSCGKGFSIRNVYPNPADSDISVSLEVEESGSYSAALYSIGGKFVTQLFSDRAVAAGRRTLQSPLKGVKSGAYLLTITNRSGDKAVSRLIVK